MRGIWAGVLGTLFLVAAGCGPSAAVRACRRGCQRDHDACMLAARNAAEIQRCDDRSSYCFGSCR